MIRFALTFAVFICFQLGDVFGENVPAQTNSSFDGTKVSRNPFERIEAKYLVARAVEVLAATDNADGDLVKLFRVSAVSIDRLSIAVINRKAFASNEVFTVKTKDKAMRVRLLKVTKDGVELDCEGRTVNVPILREWPTALQPDE